MLARSLLIGHFPPCLLLLKIRPLHGDVDKAERHRQHLGLHLRRELLHAAENPQRMLGDRLAVGVGHSVVGFHAPAARPYAMRLIASMCSFPCWPVLCSSASSITSMIAMLSNGIAQALPTMNPAARAANQKDCRSACPPIVQMRSS